jgi:peptide/nickel transport system permease protein
MSEPTVLTPEPDDYRLGEDSDVITDDFGPDRAGMSLTGADSTDVESSGATAAAAAYGLVNATGQWKDIRRRFIRNKLAVAGLIMIIIVVLVAIFAPLIAPYDPKAQDLFNVESGPSWHHLFGTDVVGRDQFAGYFGRFWDSLIMRICDIFFAFPLLVGAIVIITVVGQGVLPVIIALAIFGWATVARLLRGSILSVRESEYVEAARSLGASRWRIVTRHILPNSFAPVLIFATFNVGTAVISEAALSYLGVGVKPDVPEWGNMIAAGQSKLDTEWWLTILPSLAVVFTVLAFVFVGDGLRDALDPKLK